MDHHLKICKLSQEIVQNEKATPKLTYTSLETGLRFMWCRLVIEHPHKSFDNWRNHESTLDERLWVSL